MFRCIAALCTHLAVAVAEAVVLFHCHMRSSQRWGWLRIYVPPCSRSESHQALGNSSTSHLRKLQSTPGTSPCTCVPNGKHGEVRLKSNKQNKQIIQ